MPKGAVMKKFFKVSGYVLLALLALLIAGLGWFYFSRTGAEKRAAAKATPPPPILHAGNYAFRDLNKNGGLDP